MDMAYLPKLCEGTPGVWYLLDGKGHLGSPSPLSGREGGDMASRSHLILHVRPVACTGKAHKRQCRELAAQGVPAFNREDDVVISAQMKHEDGGDFQRVQEDRIFGALSKLLGCTLDRN